VAEAAAEGKEINDFLCTFWGVNRADRHALEQALPEAVLQVHYASAEEGDADSVEDEQEQNEPAEPQQVAE
jgi:hypothetical protein